MQRVHWLGIGMVMIVLGGLLVITKNSNLRFLAKEPMQDTSAGNSEATVQQEPISSIVPAVDASPAVVAASPKVVKPSPKASPSPIVVTPSATLTSTPKPSLLPSPTPQSDTQAPGFEYVNGPEDGSTVNFTSFCFPMKVKDNVPSGIMVRFSFNSGPNDWNTDFAPCYQNVREGWHTFVVQARDAAGNTSGFVSRYFQVVLPTPTPSPVSTAE